MNQHLRRIVRHGRERVGGRLVARSAARHHDGGRPRTRLHVGHEEVLLGRHPQRHHEDDVGHRGMPVEHRERVLDDAAARQLAELLGRVGAQA